MLPVYSVTEFISNINQIIVGTFTVEGEVSQFKVSQGKFVFFDLKDATGVLSCFVMLFKLKVPLEDGMKIRVTGYPRVREQTGRFGFSVEEVELVGDGALKRAYELLKKKLQEEGLFDVARKRAIPKIPKRIGVIASGDSAAFGDFKRILSNRWAGVEVYLRHVAVQGETAVAEIVTAFQEFNAVHDQFDVLVMIRGGGSLEDLAAFNSELVARSVYGSRIPVVCGVGHERDESLADFVADVRASTPSNAAELVVPEKKDFIAGLAFELEHMENQLRHSIAIKRQRTQTLFYRMATKLEAPIVKASTTINQFVRCYDKLVQKVARQKEFVISSERLLKNVDYHRVIKRGFSIARTKQGVIIRTAKDLDAGQELVVEFASGSALTHVQETYD